MIEEYERRRWDKKQLLSARQNQVRYAKADIADAVIQALRFKGLPVFLNTNKRTGVKVYRTGKAPRMVVGLGYKALAKGVQL